MMANMTIRELLNALQASGLDIDREVRAVIDEGAEDNCGIKDVIAAESGDVLLILNVDEIG